MYSLTIVLISILIGFNVVDSFPNYYNVKAKAKGLDYGCGCSPNYYPMEYGCNSLGDGCGCFAGCGCSGLGVGCGCNLGKFGAGCGCGCTGVSNINIHHSTR